MSNMFRSTLFVSIVLYYLLLIINGNEFDSSSVRRCDNTPCSEYELEGKCQVYQNGQGCAQCISDHFKLDVNHMCEQCQFIFGERCLHCQDINGCGQCATGYERIEDPATGLWYCNELDTTTPQQVTSFSNALLACFAAYPNEITDQSYYNSFINYCTDFDKLDLYPIDGSDNYVELKLRYLTYVESQERIIQLNSDFSQSMNDAGITTEILQDMIDEIGIGDIGASEHYGNTMFSDLTEDEKITLLGIKKEDNTTIRRMMQERRRMAASWQTVNPIGIWGSYFTNLIGFTTQVKDQDCGDCWSFAAVGQFETNYHIATGQKVVFSEQHTLDCRNGGADCGGGTEHTFNEPLIDYVNRGLCTHEGFGNYVGYERTCPSEPSCDTDHTAFASTAVELSPWDDFRAATQWVSTNRAMTFAMWVPDSIYSVTASWPFIIGCSNTDPIIGGHAMTIVGQYHSPVNDKTWLLVKNSWSEREDWGMNGYAWVYEGAKDTCYNSFNDLPGTLGFAWNTFSNIPQFEYVCPTTCDLKDSTKICKCEDNPNCRVCHSTAGCEQCKRGFFQKTRRHRCESCADTFGVGCLGCNNYHGCRQCASGYHRFYDYDCGLWYCST